MAAKPKTVYLLVDTPSQSRAIQEGQEPTTMACYPCDVEGNDSIEDTVKANWHRVPIGSTIQVTTDAKCDSYEVKPSLVPVT